MELKLSITKGGKVSVLYEFDTSKIELNYLYPSCYFIFKFPTSELEDD